MRFSPLREEEVLEERMLTPLISSSECNDLQINNSKRKSKVEQASEAHQEFQDIVSVTILRQLWHVADTIFKHLDAVSLLHCEKVNITIAGLSCLDKTKSFDTGLSWVEDWP